MGNEHGRNTISATHGVYIYVRHDVMRNNTFLGSYMVVNTWTLEICRLINEDHIERLRIEKFRNEHDMNLYISEYVGYGGVAQIERFYSTHICRIIVE